jgi:BMFP domain-containing protein YqiC
MQIHTRITTTLLIAMVLAGLNANAQFPFSPPDSTPPLTRNIQAEVAQMTRRYGLSEDQATKVTTILQDETNKSEEVFSNSTLTMQQQFTRLQSVKKEEISRVSDVLIPEQKQRYEADVRPTPLAQSSASGAAPKLPNLPSSQ